MNHASLPLYNDPEFLCTRQTLSPRLQEAADDLILDATRYATQRERRSLREIGRRLLNKVAAGVIFAPDEFRVLSNMFWSAKDYDEELDAFVTTHGMGIAELRERVEAKRDERLLTALLAWAHVRRRSRRRLTREEERLSQRVDELLDQDFDFELDLDASELPSEAPAS